MTNKVQILKFFFCFMLAVTALLSPLKPAHSAELLPYVIGYLELKNDPRYEAPRAYAGIEVRPRHRPYDGAFIAIRGAKITGRALGIKLSLQRASSDTPEGIANELKRLHIDHGVSMFLVDAPADILKFLSSFAQNLDILIFNVSEPDDALRADDCAANLMHTLPSQAMLNDAMAQFLVSSRWKDILVLKGEFPEDEIITQAFLSSAKKFGLLIVDVRDFVLGSDPRQRHKNNIALLTSGADYDAVFVADSLGQVGRYIPYQTALPRPVVGSEG